MKQPGKMRYKTGFLENGDPTSALRKIHPAGPIFLYFLFHTSIYIGGLCQEKASDSVVTELVR